MVKKSTIETHVKRSGCQEQFDNYRLKLLTLLDEAQDTDGESLAGFLFAFASVGEEISKRKSKNFK